MHAIREVDQKLLAEQLNKSFDYVLKAAEEKHREPQRKVSTSGKITTWISPISMTAELVGLQNYDILLVT